MHNAGTGSTHPLSNRWEKKNSMCLICSDLECNDEGCLCYETILAHRGLFLTYKTVEPKVS